MKKIETKEKKVCGVPFSKWKKMTNDEKIDLLIKHDKITKPKN